VEYVELGKTGLKVSRVCLGCMSFGDESGWMVTAAEGKKIIARALDLGITFFDTADVYSDGKSERIVGTALAGRRSDLVIATKVGLQFGRNPKNIGLSHSRILRQAAGSLERLKTNYVDLYQIHRWDYATPIDETLSALTGLVREGKVRHIGASSMLSWQFVQTLWTSETNGYESFASMQNRYNLVYREEEREMIPACRQFGTAIIPYSPLARGFLSGKYEKGRRWRSARYRTDKYFKGAYFYDNDFEVLERVEEVARERGVSPAQVALAWHFSKPWVTAPILGATSAEQVEEAVEALEVRLSGADVKRLEELYSPHVVHSAIRPPE
jgi:aryl-alcohol dehydrogenase-like predicted oxidoreductase